jgi:isoleucyl-tRNA synthetase
LVREVIRHVQDLRKSTGLEVSDWIHLYLEGLADLAPYFETIGREVLARTVSSGPPPGGGVGTVVQLDVGDDVRTATVWLVKA